MQDITREDLAQHLERIAISTQDEMDELLKDVLVTAWPTKIAQDS